MNGWQGPLYPNASTAKDAFTFDDVGECGVGGCLFRIDQDPSEHVDLVDTELTRAAEMLAIIQKLNATTFSPDRGPGEGNVDAVDDACKAAADVYGGFWGPFVEAKLASVEIVV